MKKFLIIVLIALFALIGIYLYYYSRWKPFWSLEPRKTVYSVTHHGDDTLRVVMIGDSWVGMRTDTLNKLFQTRLSKIINRPVIVKTKGKGGEKSRGIYQLMFEMNGLGTKSLLSEGVNYCIVIAGINDAAANIGKKQYIHHMKLILDFLLKNRIRPIIIEIPDVKIWSVYGRKPFKDLFLDYLRSLMAGCGMYRYSEYREALKSILNDDTFKDLVLFVPMNGWNGDDLDPNRLLFLDDQIHLNQQGYIKLDSCIVNAISQDL